ncbi:helix-loop-helix DNA-binding domain-containing protein [Gorgonomyces haynaldii]|nr:helix-loop-helix DNA-binding domain-containing protein [Gorgonomyces haynaldii]
MFNYQQQQWKAGYPGNKPQLGNMDPSMLTLGQVVKEEDFLEANPMGDFDVLRQDNPILSPLSTSPLDQDLLTADRSSRSLNNSPFGTPGLSNSNGYYSMSMPPQQTQQFTPQEFMQPQSYSSFQGVRSNASNSVEEDPNQRATVDAINEKRRRRRESHNAVERRRRDHINEKIQELSSLLPEFASDAQNKPNKGVILRRSVEYIRHMQVFAARQMDRTLELEQVLMTLCQTRGINENDLGLSFPLGTPIQMPILSAQNNPEDGDDLM